MHESVVSHVLQDARRRGKRVGTVVHAATEGLGCREQDRRRHLAGIRMEASRGPCSSPIRVEPGWGTTVVKSGVPGDRLNGGEHCASGNNKQRGVITDLVLKALQANCEVVVGFHRSDGRLWAGGDRTNVARARGSAAVLGRSST